jgi:DNA-binding NarL/FixJ family response regulator
MQSGRLEMMLRQLSCRAAPDDSNCGLDSHLTSAANHSARLTAIPAEGERRVVVAGGHSLVRAARCSLAAHAGLHVVGDTAHATAAADAAELSGAVLVLVDVEIEGGCVQAVQNLVGRIPGIAVLVVTPSLDPRVLLAAVRAGAEGLVTEAAGADGFARAVEAALNGEAVIPRDGVAALIEEVRVQARVPATPEADVLVQLPRRRAERQARPATRALESMS